MPAIDHFGNEE